MFKSEFNLQPVLLNDDLVSLRPLQEDDFGTLFAAASNPLIWEQHPSPDRYKQEVFKLYFDNALASKTAMLVIDNVSGETIGSTRFYDYNSETQSVDWAILF